MPNPPSRTRQGRNSQSITYEQVVRDVKDGHLSPLYYLMGEESYYIDRVADYIVSKTLGEAERDFNLLTFFGAETDIGQIVTAALGFPMGASHLVIVVKEAQGLKHLERLERYLRKPQPTTILIFCHKGGTLDGRQAITKLINKTGVVFESRRLYDRELPGFVNGYLRRQGAQAESGAAEMLADAIGADLNRLASEIDKLLIALPAGTQRLVTCEAVRSHVASTRSFNVFELQEALTTRDAVKVGRIVKYFDNNPKDAPLQMVLPMLFRFYANLMIAYYAPDRSERGLADWLKMSDWQVRRNVLPALKVYKASKVMQILSALRQMDGRSKGVMGSSVAPGELMKELFYFILH